MCIICTKPIGYAMPSDDTIMTMMDNNPDGAGFAVADGKSVEIYKGYFTVFELLDALHDMGDLTERAVVFHTRIGTSGGITSETCHPFPVTSNIEIMQSTHVSCSLAYAHNGVFSEMPTAKGISDSMAYNRDILAPLYALAGDSIVDDENVDSVINSTIDDSRIVLINYAGDIVLYGQWVEDGGLSYSNSSYKSYNYDLYGYRLPHANHNEDIPFHACARCSMFYDCLGHGPYCQDEFEAEEVSDGTASYGPRTYDYGIDDDDIVTVDSRSDVYQSRIEGV